MLSILLNGFSFLRNSPNIYDMIKIEIIYLKYKRFLLKGIEYNNLLYDELQQNSKSSSLVMQ